MRLVNHAPRHTHYGRIDWVAPKKLLADRIGFLAADRTFKALQHATKHARGVSALLEASTGYLVRVHGCESTPEGVSVEHYSATGPCGFWVYLREGYSMSQSELFGLPMLKGFYTPSIQLAKPGLPYGLMWRAI